MVVLNSAEVATEKNKNDFKDIIAFLIWELLGEPFELDAKIDDNNSFNISITGRVIDDTKGYRINLDVGLFRMIYDVVYVLLSNNRFFPEIGYSSGEFRIPTIEQPDWNSLDIAMSTNDPVYFDAERKELHKFIYTLCLHFIARHEIRHIANGHIGYLVSQRNSKFVERSGNGLSPLDSQTWEMDVDSCVFSGIVHGFMTDPKHLDFTPKKLRDHRGIFQSIFFALKILFYCLPSRKVTRLKEIENSSHPNSTLRYFFSFTAALTYMQEKYPEFVELFGSVYKESWGDFLILDAQGLLPYQRFWSDYEWSMSEEGFAYAHKIWNNWNPWRKKLTPFAYLELAPEN